MTYLIHANTNSKSLYYYQLGTYSMTNIPYIDRQAIRSVITFPELIHKLSNAFQANQVTTPPRHHHEYQGTRNGEASTLLLMPSWKYGEDLGVKMVTVSPDNSQNGLPAVNGIYVLFDAATGMVKAILDGAELTAWRTAATSALASSHLSRQDSSKLLMIGTGALAPYLIKAHASVRPIEKVIIWGRNKVKAEQVAKELHHEDLDISIADNLNESISTADIISCATLSSTALITGKDVDTGQHIDLVGAYRKDMRESDDALIKKVSIYIDTKTAIDECGDLYQPINQGIINAEDIKADLFQLCSSQNSSGRVSNDEITLFKSVGHALEDFVAAQLVWQKQF